MNPEWPEKPDQLGYLIALVEDIRNILSSFALAPHGLGAANEPSGGGEHPPPAAGRPFHPIQK
jgi:hypothetical protein